MTAERPRSGTPQGNEFMQCPTTGLGIATASGICGGTGVSEESSGDDRLLQAIATEVRTTVIPIRLMTAFACCTFAMWLREKEIR